MSDINKSIKCRVNDCKYYDSSEYCKLTDIVIGTDANKTKSCCETECLSFECNC